MEYTTLSALKWFLGITGASEDASLAELITEATALVDIELGDNLAQVTKTRRIDGSGEPRIIMENTVNSVTSVINAVTWYEYSSDFIEGKSVYFAESIPKWRKNIAITYSKGYATVPRDMERYFLHYCRELYTMASSSELEQVKTQSLGGGLSLTYFSPSELMGRMVWLDSVIAKYKNFNI